MTKSAAILIVSAVCLFSLIGITQAQDEAPAPAPAQAHFHVEGMVYCDACRAQFENRLSKPMPGAEVRLECRNRTDERVTLTAETKTDDSGVYRLLVDSDHEDEICEMILKKSSMDDCTEIPNEGHAKESARVSLTVNNGMAGTTRHANPLFFVKKEVAPECAEVFKELELLPEDVTEV